MNHKWVRVQSSIPNLNVLMVDGEEVGFIEKPKDSKTGQNAWRVYVGIGHGNRFIGHQWSKTNAQRMLESVFVGNVRGFNYGVK